MHRNLKQSQSEKKTESVASPSRRDFLCGIGGAVLAAGATRLETPAAAQNSPAFRFVFMPDIHLRQEYNSPQGMAASLDAVGKLTPKPAFIVTGGDQCHDLRSENLEGATARADLFVKIWKQRTKLPAYHLLGNHDAAGWGKGNIPQNHPQFGFNLLKQKLGMKDLYYSFDHGGWHFVVLHNVKLTEPGKHIGEFDEAQLAFLKKDLQANKTKPTMLFCHLPPVSAIEFFDGRAKKTAADWTLDYSRVVTNPQALVEAMREGNVRGLLSGHIHRLDRIEAAGQTFICSGSVSGAQWRGPEQETPAGFAVVDCLANGAFAYRYHDYGWKAPSIPEGAR